MGPDNQHPLDELKLLDLQIDQVTDLAGLKPMFFRLDEIARGNPADFEIQLGVSELKQRIVARGTELKQQATTGMRESPRTLKLPALPKLPPTQTSPAAAPPPVPPAFQAPPEPLAEPSVAGSTMTMSAITMSGVGPPPAPSAPTRQTVPPNKQWKQALIFGIVSGAVIAIAVVAILVNQARRRNLVTAVPVQVATVPPGASIRINGETKCNANCSVPLVAGDYQVMAVLDGYEPATSLLKVSAGEPTTVNLKLEPQAQVLRILTDLPQGQVILDDQAPAELQDGQFVLNNVPPGTHVVKVISKTGDATFPLQIAEATPPAVTGPIAARNLVAVLVATLGAKARVMTNSPMKLAVNGQAQADASPAGVDLTGFRAGANEIAVGEGNDRRTLAESFGPSPMLTAFLKSDMNIGTLIVSTAEDDVRVFLNGKEYPRKTQRGQLRVPTLGVVAVRVTKDGFELPSPQVAEVKKGSEVRVEFKLAPLPRVAVLQIREGTPGAEVVLDQKPVGTVADDGSFNGNAIPPGDHLIELRRENYTPKRLQRQFVAGKVVALAGPDAVLAAAIGTVHLTRTPAEAAVVYRRAEETQTREARGNQIDLAPGNYVFTARAAGFAEKTERLQVAAGEAHTLELALARAVVTPPPPPPAPKTAGVADFEDPNAWSKQGDLWTHKGGGFIPFKLPANGTYTFSVRLLRGGSLFRGGRIRWAVQYMDGKNYDLFELDRKTLSSKVIIAGKVYERGKYEHGLSDKEMSYTVQVDVAPDKLQHRLQDGANWLVLDTWSEPGRNFTEGKFAFLIQGSDEIGLSDFKFVPR